MKKTTKPRRVEVWDHSRTLPKTKVTLYSLVPRADVVPETIKYDWDLDDPDSLPFWLPEAVLKDPVFWGIVERDNTGDQTKLVKALKSSQSSHPDVQFYLGDMLERYEKGRGRPRKPAYDRSATEQQLLLASAEADALIAEGKDRDDAINEAAGYTYDPDFEHTQHASFADQIDEFMKGRYDGRTNRAKKRRPKRKSGG
jgi:hypothetical protein